jgi:hypothetical protein
MNFWLRLAKEPSSTPSADVAARRKQGLEKLHEFVRRYAAAGGRLITGPDTGTSSGPTNMPGISMHIEMEALVDAGVTPMQALLASTKWPAELLKKEKELGTVEPGKLADLIVVDRDPLADIRNTRAISAVVLAGKVVDTTLDPDFRNPMPRAVAVDNVLEYLGPKMNDFNPKIASQGQGNVKIEILGERFRPNTFARLDTTDLTTKFINPGKLEAEIPAKLLRQVGSYYLSVVNPGSAGGVSNGRYFVVKFAD